MKKRQFARFMAATLAAAVLMPSVAASAETMIVSETGEELLDASWVDDAEAVEQAASARAGNELANPAKAAQYLLSNKLEEVVAQVPTDKHDTTLPAVFDLRDRGVVTPVKLQNPFGTCWGFSAIAASETSILSSLGMTYEEAGLDLSEHHLTWFVRTHLEDEESPQNGEGIYMVQEEEHLNGGTMFEATSLFASGIGPVDEELIPYRGRGSKTVGYGPIRLEYSEDDDWSLPYEYAFLQAYTLKESVLLPDTAVYRSKTSKDPDDREAAYLGYDASAADAWKRELLAGRAISVAFCADMSMPKESGGIPMFMNEEDNQWTHFTFDGTSPNHGVTIVGWDDTIPRTSFLDHTDDAYGDGQAHFPEGDGAWIVKNSWGASTEGFPNNGKWGKENENGASTGYFYLSYYDRSICYAETFAFDVTDHDDDTFFEVDQHDYMQADSPEGWADKNGLQMANIFTAEDDGELQAVSCKTNMQNVSVTYQVYLMDEDHTVPTEGRLVSTVNEDYAYAGYHRATLEEPVTMKKGQRYAVVVTACFMSGDDLFYEFATWTGNNQEYTEEYNRKVHYRNRNCDYEDYKDELISSYYKGIVNEGESLVYMNELGQWGDLAQIIPYLQESEDYIGCDFDNFPIKGYIDLTPEAQALITSELPELNFAEPASMMNLKYLAILVLAVLVSIVLLVVYIVLLVKKIKMKKKKKARWKELEEKEKLIPQLEAEIERLKNGS